MQNERSTGAERTKTHRQERIEEPMSRRLRNDYLENAWKQTMMNHYKRSTEAEKTPNTKEMLATKTKIKVTIKARHCHRRNKPRQAK